jgi:hypothetical protein
VIVTGRSTDDYISRSRICSESEFAYFFNYPPVLLNKHKDEPASNLKPKITGKRKTHKGWSILSAKGGSDGEAAIQSVERRNV